MSTIDVTAAGAMAYEQMLLSRVDRPAHGIADMETLRAAGAHPSQRQLRMMQLQAEAEQIEAAMAVLNRAALRYGMPAATILREGASGMRLAARRLTEAA